MIGTDPSSLSNLSDWRTTKFHLDLTVDFDKKIVTGTVLLAIKPTHVNVTEIVLDTSYLDIHSISIGDEDVDDFTLDERNTLGSALHIPHVLRTRMVNTTVHVSIKFSTTSNCTALQWLPPAQTSGKQHPYLFSQCQAIHARSLFPCQDTPSIKAPYTARVRSRLPVVMSALRTSTSYDRDTGLTQYNFEQPLPIPSYLVALASGDLASARIGPRSTLWTEPQELLASKWEFEHDTEEFIRTAESTVSNYAWQTYDILILPPSFPYGGMENPNMTFATPTLVSGDRSNVDVVAHELAHSWSGNLVTNVSWEHFWLNEGWTVYLERKILREMHGEEARQFSALIGYQALVDSVDEFTEQGHLEYTRLIPDLTGCKDPDDAFSSVPYEKGFALLYHIEKSIGMELMDEFTKAYFAEYRLKTIDSFTFRSFLESWVKTNGGEEVSQKLAKEVDWDDWFYAEGLPKVDPNFDTTLAEKCYALAKKWEEADDSASFSKDDIKNWLPGQLVLFLDKLGALSTPLSATKVEKLAATYDLRSSHNAEVLSRYYAVALKSKWSDIYMEVADWLGTVGRMKFVRPTYRLLRESNKELAVKTFERLKDFYHPICREMVKKDLGL
ncbi:Leucyl aminopeptidase yscIV [Saitoella coloradoensis]